MWNQEKKSEPLQGITKGLLPLVFHLMENMHYWGSWDNTLKLWDINTGIEIRTFEGHRNEVNSVAFSPDGKYALSGSYDKTLILWDIRTGNEIRIFSGHFEAVTSLNFSPDGKYAISGKL